MADTIQGVYWALEKNCAFRNGKDMHLPRIAQRQTSGMRTIASSIKNKHVLGGYCITSYTNENDAAGKTFELPCSVQRVADLLPQGNVAAAQSLCASCEAHATKLLSDS